MPKIYPEFLNFLGKTLILFKYFFVHLHRYMMQMLHSMRLVEKTKEQ